jgi:putative membrane protein insertion efficiency factor
MTAAREIQRTRRPAQAALLGAVRFYQRAISPTRPPRCRFVPTCSAYAVEAVEVHGAARGSWLAVRRIAKCAPWHPGGVDLVPEPAPRRRTGTSEGARSSNTAAPVPAARPAGAATPATEEPALLTADSSSTAGPRPGPAAGGLR